ncbi:hypothetical protein [Zoogloea sp.]|uniref:hypothetical protein n=2 Tax=Zoogloea sp. TaxID=49181 RepID=UPI0035B4A30E
MKSFITLVTTLLVTACAPLGGPMLRPGSTPQDIYRVLGEPAMRWREADGGERLAYPRGPMGFQTWMVRTDATGKVISVENVMDMAHFARIQPGMDQDEVLRILGPSFPGWTIYFKARDELVWEWRYCDVWSEPARFSVLFDGSSRRVRTTLSQPERLSQPWGRGDRREWCSR